VAAFHHRMEELYSAADFAVARSGAASLAELAAFALPAILIPFPYAADDHQARNAEVFVKADAAILVKESEILDDALAQKMIGNDEKQMQGYKDRSEIREVMGDRLAREIILEPKSK